MDDLIADFIAETREMLDALGGEIVAWEAAPDDRARLDSIFRFVHTVKGNSGFFDLPRITALAHAAEDVLVQVRSGQRVADSSLVTAVLAVIDRLGELVEAITTGETAFGAGDEELVAALSEQAAPPTHAASATVQRPAARTVRLPVDLLDRIMSSVSDLMLTRNDLARALRVAGPGAEVDAAFESICAGIADMREAVTRTRMQRIDHLFATLPRLVRDLSAGLGKSVALDIAGGDVELDREMIESLRDPIAHIVRNAIDHGIEPAAEREAVGKPATGTLQIVASQAGNMILIEIADDGRGIDGDRLAAKAVAKSLLSAAEMAGLSREQRVGLIFEPGLSTAAEITEISGRGVGMDVVRANIERIGGLVEIDSRRGQGLRLILKVPLTLTIIPALTVGISGQIFAIPRSSIEEIVRICSEAVRVETLGSARIATIRGLRMPILSLGEALGIEHLAATDEQSLIVLQAKAGQPFALAVDYLFDHEEIVVRPAAPALVVTGLYAGTTLAADGSPILLLDPLGLAARCGVAFFREAPRAPVPSEASEAPGMPALLITTLSGKRRAVPLAAVDRIEDAKPGTIGLSGGRLHVTSGEALLPLLGCGTDIPTVPIRILRLFDGARTLAYGFADVVDIIALAGDVLPVACPGEVAGITLFEGVPIELLDLHWLFRDDAGEVSGRPVCALPAGDKWMTTFLAPLIESAGYRIIASDDPGAEFADIRIVDADAPDAAEGVPARLVRLRSNVAPSGADDDSIHRYDRAGLLAALRHGVGA